MKRKPHKPVTLFKVEGLSGGRVRVFFFGKRLPIVPGGAPAKLVLERLAHVFDPEVA